MEEGDMILNLTFDEFDEFTKHDSVNDIWSTERGIEMLKKQCEITGQDWEYVRGLLRRLDAPKCNADDLRGITIGVSISQREIQKKSGPNYTPPKKKHKKHK